MIDHPNVRLVRDYLALTGESSFEAAAAFFGAPFIYVVPGDNPLAGVYRDRTAAMDYFGRLMSVSGGTSRIDGEVDWLVSDTRALLIVDESMTVAGQVHAWTRYILFRIREGRFAEVRLLKDDQRASDALWARNVAFAGECSGAT